MEVLHQTEEPRLGTETGLLEPCLGRATAIVAHCITLDTCNGHDALFRCKPAGLRWVVAEQEETDDGNTEGNDSFNDEELTLACDAVDSIKGCEDCGGDKARAAC